MEERLVSELQDLQDKQPELKSGKRLLCFDDLRSLPFLHAVIQVCFASLTDSEQVQYEVAFAFEFCIVSPQSLACASTCKSTLHSC